MDKMDLAVFQPVYDAYARASWFDIISAILLLIPFGLLASRPLVWALRKGYKESVKQFELVNPHLKGQYFSFWKWVSICSESTIREKHYKKRFGELPYVNTDSPTHLVRELKEETKGFAKDFSLPTKIAIVLLVVIMASILV